MNHLAKIKDLKIPVVTPLDFTSGLDDLVNYTKALKGVEGFVLVFKSGHRAKIKAEEYVRIHKVKDKIRLERHILSLLLENELDDVYPHLDKIDYDRVKQYEHDFNVALKAKIASLESAAQAAWKQANFDKKNLATKVLPASGVNKADWPFVFKHADGSTDFSGLVMAHIASHSSNTPKYNEMAKWLGMPSTAKDETE